MKPHESQHVPQNITLPKDATVFFQNEGYLRVRYFDEAVGRKVCRTLSRLIWETLHGPLPSDWVVHHCDSAPLNNDPCNLQAMPRLEHSRLHRLNPELKSQLYVDYQAANPGKEHAKYVKWVAHARNVRREAKTCGSA